MSLISRIPLYNLALIKNTLRLSTSAAPLFTLPTFGLQVRKKHYAVCRGRKPGIYPTAEKAIVQTNKFSHNCMRVFTDREQAEKWLRVNEACQSQVDMEKTLAGEIWTGKAKSGGGPEGGMKPVVEWMKGKGV